MGLDIYVKGLKHEDSYHSSYSGFSNYRKLIAKAYDVRLGEIYEKGLFKSFNDENLSLEEIE